MSRLSRRRSLGHALSLAPLALVFAVLCAPLASAQRVSDPLCQTEGACPVLMLDDFLNQVLRANPAARALLLEGDRAQAEILDARGGFDPYLTSGYEYKTQDDKAKLNVLQSGVALPFDLPMSPNLMLDYRRGRGSSIDPSVLTTPGGETRFGVSVSPLQGFATDKRRAALSKALIEPDIAMTVQARGRNRILLDATEAFWVWVEAGRILQINQELLDLATQRLDLVVRQARAGETAAVDSVEAELAVVSREGKVVSAQRKAEEARVKLDVFLWNEDGTPQTTRYTPPPVPLLPPPPDADAAVTTAFAQRPELQELALEQQQLNVEQRLAREQLRPDLKLEAQVVSYDDGPLGVSDVKVGFKIDQPLFFRGGRSQVERANIEVQALRFKQDLLQRTVRADVEAVLVALEQSRQRVVVAERRVALAERLQAAEQRRFELGESTLFLVNQREQAFAEAREERVAAQVEVLLADAAFRWATGTITARVNSPDR